MNIAMIYSNLSFMIIIITAVSGGLCVDFEYDMNMISDINTTTLKESYGNLSDPNLKEIYFSNFKNKTGIDENIDQVNFSNTNDDQISIINNEDNITSGDGESCVFTNLVDTVIDISNVINTAVKIAEKEFVPQAVTIVMWNQDDDVDVSQLLVEYRGSVILAPIQADSYNLGPDLYLTVRFTQIIFVASTSSYFKEMAINIQKYVVIPVRAILILTLPIHNETQVSEATKAAWENDVGNIVIVGIQSDTKTIKLWTYLPYGNGECENYTAVPLDIRAGYYPRKYQNFHRCPARVTLLHFVPTVLLEKENDTVLSISGIDGQTLNLIMKKLNASFDIVSSTDHGGVGTIKNGNATGSFGDLVNGIADIFIPAIMLSDLRYPKVQFSYVYNTLDAYWWGPNQCEIYAWAKVLLPFFSNISPFIIISFVVFVVVTKVIRRYALCQPERKKGIFFMTFVMFLGQEVSFETKCWLVNSLFVLWIWFCMIVRIGYQGDLVDGLQKVILEPPLGTFDEAVEKLEGYGGVEAFSHFYKDTPRAANYKTVSLRDVPSYIKEVSEGKRFLLVTNILLIKWFRQPLQVLEKPVTRAAVCIQMRAGWPAGDEVRTITYNIAESGFIQKIFDDFQYEWLIHSANDQAEVKEAEPLGMKILAACFYGLLVMFAVCFAIFCGEIVCHKYELNSKIKRKFKVK